MFGDVMAVLWRCSARLWRDLDDALKDELYRIRGRGPPPDDLRASIHDRDSTRVDQ